MGGKARSRRGFLGTACAGLRRALPLVTATILLFPGSVAFAAQPAGANPVHNRGRAPLPRPLQRAREAATWRASSGGRDEGKDRRPGRPRGRSRGRRADEGGGWRDEGGGCRGHGVRRRTPGRRWPKRRKALARSRMRSPSRLPTSEAATQRAQRPRQRRPSPPRQRRSSPPPRRPSPSAACSCRAVSRVARRRPALEPGAGQPGRSRRRRRSPANPTASPAVRPPLRRARSRARSDRGRRRTLARRWQLLRLKRRSSPRRRPRPPSSQRRQVVAQAAPPPPATDASSVVPPAGNSQSAPPAAAPELADDADGSSPIEIASWSVPLALAGALMAWPGRGADGASAAARASPALRRASPAVECPTRPGSRLPFGRRASLGRPSQHLSRRRGAHAADASGPAGDELHEAPRPRLRRDRVERAAERLAASSCLVGLSALTQVRVQSSPRASPDRSARRQLAVRTVTVARTHHAQT